MRCVMMFLVLLPAEVSASGILSFEQECRTGYCPATAGPASCVAIGNTRSKGTAIITAKHCVQQRGNRFFIVGKDLKREATLVSVSSSADIAILHTSGYFRCKPVTYSPPALQSVVRLEGALSRRLQSSEGKLDRVDSNATRFWFRGVWSHSGMSGGALMDTHGNVFGVQSAKVVGSDETIGYGGDALKQLVTRFEQRYGPLTLAAGSIVQQQGAACRKCGKVHAYDCVPATIALPRQQVDYRRVASEVYRIYGDRLRGQDGRNGTNGKDGGADPRVSQLVTRLLSIERRILERDDNVPDYAELLARLKAIESHSHSRRVVIIDGRTGTALDDETYAQDEPIVLDIRRLLESAQ